MTDDEVVEFVKSVRAERHGIEDSLRGANMKKIDSFRNEYFFLSNFYEAPVFYDGVEFRNNEAAFQAQKVAHTQGEKPFIDPRREFVDLNPSEAKKLGRRVPLRKDWESVKVGIMKEIVRAKFEQNKDLAEKLIQTGNAILEEGNGWGDRTWGTVNGQGKNLLGKILMEVRE